MITTPGKAIHHDQANSAHEARSPTANVALMPL